VTGGADERYLMAVHETAHAAVAHVLRRPVGLVSIRPTAESGGFARHRCERIKPGTFRPELPTILMPARLRRTVESEIVISLAGQVAEILAGPPAPGYRGLTDDERQAVAASRSLAALDPREESELHEIESTIDQQPTDSERASGLSYALAGDEAAQHFSWMRAVAMSVVASDRVQRLIAALVPELLAHEVLPPRRVRAIFKSVDTEHA